MIAHRAALDAEQIPHQGVDVAAELHTIDEAGDDGIVQGIHEVVLRKDRPDP